MSRAFISTYAHTCMHTYTHVHTHAHTHTHAQLSYYDSKQEGKCHGTISLSDIQGVEEAEPTSVGKGEGGVVME